MIVLTNSLEQTVAVGDAIIFDTVLEKAGSCECTRNTNTSVKICGKGFYNIHYHASVAGSTSGKQLELQIGGESMTGGVMDIPPAGTPITVSVTVPIRVCCRDYNRVRVINSGTEPVTIAAGSIFYIEKLCCS